MPKVVEEFDNVIAREKFTEIITSCKNNAIGKLLPNALYVHFQALKALEPLLQAYERAARKLIENLDNATIVKFSLERPKISYLFYPDFDRDPHPRLHKSIVVDLSLNQISHRQYQNSSNPPILHRKETFVTPDYPCYSEFTQLTQAEVDLGLLDNPRLIGTQQEWHKLLSQQGIDFVGHRLICPLNSQVGTRQTVAIDRHKAALQRNELSRPVRIALEAELFAEGTTFLIMVAVLAETCRELAIAATLVLVGIPIIVPIHPKLQRILSIWVTLSTLLKT